LLDAKIAAVVDQALAPLEKPLADGLKMIFPAGAVTFIQRVGTEPLKKAAAFAFRVIIAGRSHMENVLHVLIPLGMNGVNAALEYVKKLQIPPGFKKILLKAIDKTQDLFGGIAAAFLDAVAPEVKDMVTQVLDSVTGG